MKKTLIVLGAGASKDFCDAFPTGAQLFADIDRHFRTAPYEVQAPGVEEPVGQGEKHYLSSMIGVLRSVLKPEVLDENVVLAIENQVFKAHRVFEYNHLRGDSGNYPSVDYFIAQALSDGRLSPTAGQMLKMSIAYLIKGAEEAVHYRDSKKRIDPDNWIRRLCLELYKLNLDEVRDKLRVFNFNYDRAFEQYFTKYMTGYGGTHASVLPNIHHHVYGSIGSLQDIPFDGKNDNVELMKGTYPCIRLMFDERRTPLPDVSDFQVVHFLGFGYDPENLKVLGLPTTPTSTLTGTGYNMPHDDRVRLKWESRIQVWAEEPGCKAYVEKVLVPDLIS
ncbi:MAG: hypothetical protein IPM46_01730 [Flavobacteriales bacterium]|nr:hypothetical protein [Flavobacteriales bacterium]